MVDVVRKLKLFECAGVQRMTGLEVGAVLRCTAPFECMSPHTYQRNESLTGADTKIVLERLLPRT